MLCFSHLYFNDIDFTDQCIVRSSLLPTRIQSYIQKFNDYKTIYDKYYENSAHVLERVCERDIERACVCSLFHFTIYSDTHAAAAFETN